MKDRVSDERLEMLVGALKRRSSGRSENDSYPFRGGEIRELLDVCKDLKDARALLEKTAWLRKPEKKKK